MITRGIIIFAAIILSLPVYAQNGFLRGKILDGDTGEGLIGAAVYKEGTTTGTVTDFDGNYSLALEPGVHNVIFQFVSYKSQTVTGVEIKAGEATVIDITLSPDVAELEEIVVTAKQLNDNEVAMLAMQGKSPNFVNGISSQAFRKIGDSDLGSAMKRVTGVSVEGGKYVYVRGLGDRYTKTIINHMPIPGLDPDRNTIQIDIFPTSTIENVVVYKTFTPDLMGDFSGGIVDIETKNFPEQKQTQVSLGFEYNPQSHFNEEFTTYDGGSSDLLGFDNGDRKLPIDKSQNIPDIVTDGEQNSQLTSSFGKKMSAQQQSQFLNYSFNINHGNQINRQKATWGYNAVFNYTNKKNFDANAESGLYWKPIDKAETELFRYKSQTGPVGEKNVLWSALISTALKYKNHDYSLIILHNQNGESQTTRRVSQDYSENPAILHDNVLTYTQRQVTNAVLSGRHMLNQFTVNWQGSYSLARIYDPDFRKTRIQETTDEEGNVSYLLNTGVGAGIERFWRDLNEDNKSFRLDVTYPYGEKNEVKIGGMALLKQRDFEVLEYIFRVRNRGGSIVLTNNPDDYFAPGAIYTPETDQGTFMPARDSETENARKSYNASSSTYGFYAMSEQYIGAKFRAIYGLRVEMANMYYTGQNQQGVQLQDAKTLDEVDFLPSLNFVYTIVDKQNLRASYNRTLARPSFKEKSNAQIYDPIRDLTEIGNLELEQTDIQNVDLRYEYFYGTNELVSLSLFYKHFDKPIERTAFETADNQFTWRNAGTATVYGAEIELRKNINKNFGAGLNASIVKSAIDMNEIAVNTDANGVVTTTEKENRQNSAREGEVISDTRDMVGQAPYLINAYINWSTGDKSVNTNLSYNVQGKTLTSVGLGSNPDIYTKPFHSLNLNIYKDFGALYNSRVTLRVTNILGAKKQEVYESYKAQEQTYSIYEPGRTVALVYRYTF